MFFPNNNLAAQKANKTIQHVSMHVKYCIVYFRKSTIGRWVLAEKQKSLNLPQHGLQLETPTMWNSSYISKKRFLQQRPAVIATLLDPSLMKQKYTKIINADLKNSLINDIQFSDVQHVKVIMYDKTIAISSEKCPTVSMILPLHNKLF